MAKIFNYRSNTIRSTSSVVRQFGLLQSNSTQFETASPSALRFYSEFDRPNIYDLIQYPERILCDQLIIEGWMNSKDPFPALKSAMPKMLDLRNDTALSGISANVTYEEYGCSQTRKYCNEVSLFSHGKKWEMLAYFGSGSKLYLAPDGTFQRGYAHHFNVELGREYIRRIREKVSFIDGKTEEEVLLACLKGGTLGQDFDIKTDPSMLLDMLQKIYSLFSGDRIFIAEWRHSIMDEAYAEQHAIEHLNKLAERKIEADRYKIEMRCRYTTWEALEQISKLCGPTDLQMHRVGCWKLKGRQVLNLLVATHTDGHEFVLQSNKPLHDDPNLIPSEICVAIDALNIDLTKPIAPSSFDKYKPKKEKTGTGTVSVKNQ